MNIMHGRINIQIIEEASKCRKEEPNVSLMDMIKRNKHRNCHCRKTANNVMY